MTPRFCFFTNTKQSFQYTIKIHLGGLPLPKFVANINYIPTSPPSSLRKCNKKCDCKISNGTTFDYYEAEAISQWCDTLNCNIRCHTLLFPTLNKEQKSSYLQLCRRLNGKMLVLGFLYSKSTPIVRQKMRNMSN